MSGSIIVAQAPQNHRHTLHRTDCCCALLSLTLRVKQMERTGQWDSQRNILMEKAFLISHITPSRVCQSCTNAFLNLPIPSPASSISSLSLSFEDLSQTVPYGDSL